MSAREVSEAEVADVAELQRAHDRAQILDPEHDKSCWCCCRDPDCERRAEVHRSRWCP